MSKMSVPPPTTEHLISFFVDWVARTLSARVTVNVYWSDGKHFSEEVDARLDRPDVPTCQEYVYPPTWGGGGTNNNPFGGAEK